ncbi:MAG: hypothetical protein ISR74_07455 [Candidatus Thioglobus sp.]|nr:hypothetical protein [Candidatus Thioglobus sp.]
MYKNSILLSCCLYLFVQVVNAESGRVRVSYEDIPVSATEDMGTMGVHYDVKPFGDSDVYAGFGGYGALTGDRGGFFTGGVILGYHHYIANDAVDGLAIDAGLFAGGGGGAGAFPGGGLMLRSHLMLEQEIGDVALRFGMVNTQFPNTSNSAYEQDTHPSIGIVIPTYQFNRPVLSQGGLKIANKKADKIIPVSLRYHPDSDAKRRGGASLVDDITLIGFQYQDYINDSLYRTYETYGAGTGGVDGYAKVLAGFGINTELVDDSVMLDTKLTVGMAGGGSIDTGGGLIVQPMIGLDIKLADGWRIKPMLGKTYAPSGNFSATTSELGLSWTGGKGKTEYSIKNKTYQPDDSARTKSAGVYADRIELLGFGLSKRVNDQVSVSGSAYGAYKGDVGAYAEGLFGIEVKPFDLPVHVGYEFGVGGGGGMDVGEGLIHQYTVGTRMAVNNTMDLSIDVGRMQGMDGGTFAANVFQIGLNW